MKRVYAAAALMVAVGAAIGYMLAPQAPASERQVVAEHKSEDPKPAPQSRDKTRGHSGGGGGSFFVGTTSSQNPLEKMVAAKSGAAPSRPDCYFMRVSYRSTASKQGASAPQAREAADKAKEAGCALGGG
jgi:hypothetical protein